MQIVELFKQEINFFISNSDIDQGNDQDKEYFQKCIIMLIETLQRWSHNIPKDFYKSQEIFEKLQFIHNKIQLLLPPDFEVLISYKFNYFFEF